MLKRNKQTFLLHPQKTELYEAVSNPINGQPNPPFFHKALDLKNKSGQNFSETQGLLRKVVHKPF